MHGTTNIKRILEINVLRKSDGFGGKCLKSGRKTEVVYWVHMTQLFKSENNVNVALSSCTCSRLAVALSSCTCSRLAVNALRTGMLIRPWPDQEGNNLQRPNSLTFVGHSKKIQKFVRPTSSPRQQWSPRRKKNGNNSIAFSVDTEINEAEYVCLDGNQNCVRNFGRRTLWQSATLRTHAWEYNFKIGVWLY